MQEGFPIPPERDETPEQTHDDSVPIEMRREQFSLWADLKFSDEDPGNYMLYWGDRFENPDEPELITRYHDESLVEFNAHHGTDYTLEELLGRPDPRTEADKRWWT
ncbi:hypothetical protein [Actinokineospora sp. NBRC 105648]|uniref:hypothetical protein n=1 Tax=Actinokineospora sp. NBRC 105648 TaxID=3032206 RepID=UPI0024A5CFA4|nr:hypothetical protein [Actinokineospora sp. NBRC 105648]GLZ40928.1 hypothetical protein Acsp05_45520 [Actinokineospora sp. NBRC 105648]